MISWSHDFSCDVSVCWNQVLLCSSNDVSFEVQGGSVMVKINRWSVDHMTSHVMWVCAGIRYSYVLQMMCHLKCRVGLWWWRWIDDHMTSHVMQVCWYQVILFWLYVWKSTVVFKRMCHLKYRVGLWWWRWIDDHMTYVMEECWCQVIILCV